MTSGAATSTSPVDRTAALRWDYKMSDIVETAAPLPKSATRTSLARHMLVHVHGIFVTFPTFALEQTLTITAFINSQSDLRTAQLPSPPPGPRNLQSHFVPRSLALMTSLVAVTGFNASSQGSQIPPELMSLDLNSTLGATFLGFAVTCAYVSPVHGAPPSTADVPRLDSTALRPSRHGCISVTSSQTRPCSVDRCYVYGWCPFVLN